MSNSYFEFNTINDLYDEMESVYLNDSRPWVIGYSGGKDSSAVVELTLRMLMRLPEEKRNKHIYIVSSDTMIENPIVLESLKKNIALLNQTAILHNLPISAHIVYPDVFESYWTNIIGKGYVTPKSIQYRWCTERLKIRPSNAFIKDLLEEADVIVVLGVRKDESIARKARIEKREIEGYLLTPHSTLRSHTHIAYTYSPIVDLTTADVWEVLFYNNNGTTAWGFDTQELFNMYLDGSANSGECPFVADGSGPKSTCANSRFGCWICTVVREDKSLKGFISSGHTQLQPLLDFREWILSERDLPENRRNYKRNGGYKIMEDGTLAMGSFNYEARKKVLRKLLETQNEMRKYYPNIELITIDELKAIHKIWMEEEDLTNRDLVTIYKDVTGVELPWDKHSQRTFDDDVIEVLMKNIEDSNTDKDLFIKLLLVTNKYQYLSNPKKLKTEISRLLNQPYLHRDEEKIIDREVEQALNKNKEFNEEEI